MLSGKPSLRLTGVRLQIRFPTMSQSYTTRIYTVGAVTVMHLPPFSALPLQPALRHKVHPDSVLLHVIRVLSDTDSGVDVPRRRANAQRGSGPVSFSTVGIFSWVIPRGG